MENNITTTTDSGKTAAIISYFSLLGWLIAYFAMHKDKKTELSSFHLRQTLLFAIAVIILGWGFSFVLGILIISTGILALIYLLYVVYLALFAIWIIGLLGAIKGLKTPMPIIGQKAQTIFSSI